MIQPVALGQTRFHLPGLTVDERGVAMGRRLLCLFPELGAVVGYFRSLSRTGALKDVLATLVVEEALGERGGKDIAVAFEVAGSFSADPCAAAARAAGGLCFTGTQRHYVPYRDSGRPLGCDLEELGALVPGEAGTVLYLEGGADARLAGRRWELRDLLLSLAPTPLRPRELKKERLDVVVLRVPPGLLPGVRSYLWRRRVVAEVALARPAGRALFGVEAGELGVVRCTEIPPGALSLLAGTPGIEVYVPVTDNVLVQRGFRHPVALDACAGLFPREETLLFAAARRTVERLTGPLQFVSLDDVMEAVLANEDGARFPTATPLAATDISALPVEVRLVPDRDARGSAEAVLLPAERLPDLMALVHLLPAALWFGSEVALAMPWSVVLSPGGIRALPLGYALSAVHSRVYVPVGMRFSPRLNEELLLAHLGLTGNDNVAFFPPSGVGPPFTLSRSAFQPLSRSAVHPEDLAAALEAVTLLPGLAPVQDPVVHHPTGAALRTWDGLAPPED